MLVKSKALAGGKIAGGNPENGRVEHDFYATNPKAVDMLIIPNKRVVVNTLSYLILFRATL